MESTILTSLLVLMQLICVISVVAYLLTRSRLFVEILDGAFSIRTQVVLILVFGGLSIYGTVSGVEFMGAIANVRDLGPMLAGLLGGPVAGIGAGLIGATYRMSLGGFTAVSCSLATVLAGLGGGLIWLASGRKFAGTTIAVIFAVLMEIFHMLLTVALCHPTDQAVAVVSTVALPMILANAAGMFVFSFIIGNLKKERRLQADRDTLMREMERKKTELAIAAEIQQSFLPDTIPQITGYEIAARSIMAKEVGGDFFDVIPLEVVPLGSKKMGIMIADVSGKGIPAGLFMALSRIVVRVNATWYTRDPASAIHQSNIIISDDAKSGMFVTLFYGFLDSETRVLKYVNAGHNPPIHYRASEGTLTELGPTGMAMGIVGDAEYTAESVRIVPEDVLVLYTDGITEALNQKTGMFSVERLKNVILESSALPCGEIVTKILDSVRDFTGAHPQSDDITIMVIRATGP